MSSPRYLTKSRFKLAVECPTKLYYASHPEYGNVKDGDPFLQMLADGGSDIACPKGLTDASARAGSG